MIVLPLHSLYKHILSLKDWSFKYAFYFTCSLIVFISIILLISSHHAENIPTMILSAFAMFFTYHAYLFSKEKFRLDLFERRWQIYIKTLEFLSVVIKHGTLRPNETNRKDIEAGFLAADESFRSIGWHHSQALFGSDIYNLFEKLNSSYAWLSTHQADAGSSDQWLQEMTFIHDTLKKLPKIFSPYIYFGEYKVNREINL